jgi:O-antigen ligase
MKNGIASARSLSPLFWERLEPLSALAVITFVAICLFVLKLSLLYTLVGVVGITAIVVFAARPVWAFLALVATFNAENLLGSSNIFTGTKLLGVMVFTTWLFHSLHGERYRLPRSPVLIWAPALLVCSLISMSIAEDIPAAVARIARLVQLNLLVLIAATILRSKRDVERLAWVLVVAATLPVVFVMQQVGPGGQVDTEEFLYNRNAMGLFIAVAIPFVFYFFARAAWPLRLALLAMTALFIAGEALTYSRGGFVAFGVAFFLSLLLVVRGSRTRTIVVFTVILLLIAAVLPSGIWDRLGSIVPAVLEGHDTMGLRYQLWGISWRMFESSPILGVGPGNYFTHFMRYGGTLGLRRSPLGAHNAFLGVAVELGLLGLTVFLLLIASAWRSLYRCVQRARKTGDRDLEELAYCCAIALMVLLVGAMKQSVEYYKYLWMLFGVSAALLSLASRAGAATTPPAEEPETAGPA